MKVGSNSTTGMKDYEGKYHKQNSVRPNHERPSIGKQSDPLLDIKSVGIS